MFAVGNHIIHKNKQQMVTAINGDMVKLAPSNEWVSTKEIIEEDDEAKVTMPEDIGCAKVQQHYKDSAMQPIQVMQAILTPEEFRGFLKGNVIKYGMRKNHKGQYDSDVNKVRQYAYWVQLVRDGVIIDPIRDTVPNNYKYEGI